MAQLTTPLANLMGQSSIYFVAARQRSPERYEPININLPGSA